MYVIFSVGAVHYKHIMSHSHIKTWNKNLSRPWSNHCAKRAVTNIVSAINIPMATFTSLSLIFLFDRPGNYVSTVMSIKTSFVGFILRNNVDLTRKPDFSRKESRFRVKVLILYARRGSYCVRYLRSCTKCDGFIY